MPTLYKILFPVADMLPFPLSLLPMDFQTGGNDNIFGETKESCLAAINKILERIENPLAAMTEERAAYLQQEKEFYTVLASKIGE